MVEFALNGKPGLCIKLSKISFSVHTIIVSCLNASSRLNFDCLNFPMKIVLNAKQV